MAVAGGADFLDLVYETAVDADVWPALIERFARMIGGTSAAFRSYDMLTEVGTVVAFGQDADLLDINFQAFCDRNPIKSSPEKVRREAQLRACGLMIYRPGLTVNTEWLSQQEFLRTDYYNEVYKKFDIYSDVSVGLAMDGTTWTGVDIYRSKTRGLFTHEELAVAAQAVPHLARAVKLGRTLAEQRQIGDGLAGVFEQSNYGVFLLDDVGRIRKANAVGERLLQSGDALCSRAGRLSATTSDAAQSLIALLKNAGAPDSTQRTGGAMALRTPGRSFPLSITVAPVRPERLSLSAGRPAILVCVTDPAANLGAAEQCLRDAFSLTGAESRVALALVDGLSLAEAATKFGVSLSTVRVQLGSVFSKTKTHRQAELVRVVMNATGLASGVR